MNIWDIIFKDDEYKTDIFAPIEINGHPGWTIRRVGVMVGGKYMWQLLKDGALVAPLKRPATASQAWRYALEYIEKLEK